MADTEDPPRPPDSVLSILQELVDVSRSRRRRAERAGEAADTVEAFYLVELQARLELAREREADPVNDRVMMTALICSTVMYSVAVVCLSVVVIQRPTETGEAVAAKLLALFGPLTVLLSAVVFKRNGTNPPNPR